MAVRLTVVMVHPPRGSGAAQRLSEAVVGKMIGLPGIDLTLIDRLDQINVESTDHLTLHSLAGDVAVLDWQPVGDLIDSLAKLGFDGCRAVHTHDRDGSAKAGARQIYGYDLREIESAAVVCSAINELLASRQIRTYSLDSLLPAPSTGPAQPSREPRPTAPTEPHLSAPPPQDETPVEADRPAKPPLDLDHLVDQLDSFDP